MQARNSSESVREAAAYLEHRLRRRPRVGVILGSGLNALADLLTCPVAVPYSQVPNLPASTVVGHAGQFVFGELSSLPVCVMQGRVH